MQRTISIKLRTGKSQERLFSDLGNEFHAVCNRLVPFVMEHRCWNRIALHNLSYTKIRASSRLGSQMTCNAIFARLQSV